VTLAFTLRGDACQQASLSRVPTTPFSVGKTVAASTVRSPPKTFGGLPGRATL